MPRWRVPAHLKGKEAEAELLWNARTPFKFLKHREKFKVP